MLLIDTMNGSTRWDRTAHSNNAHMNITSKNITHDAIAINRDMAMDRPAGNAGASKSLG